MDNSSQDNGFGWLAQVSIKTPSGDLINMRGRTEAEFGTAADIVATAIESGQIDRITSLLAKGKSNVAQFPKSMTSPVPAPSSSGAKAAAQGAIKVGENFVVTVDVDKVYDGKVTGRTNDRGEPTSGPATIVDAGGTKYDTFDKTLAEVARQAKRDGKRVNIMYIWNEKFQRNKIVDDGLSIFGEVPTEQVPSY